MKRNHMEVKRRLYRKQEEGKEIRWSRKIHGLKAKEGEDDWG